MEKVNTYVGGITVLKISFSISFIDLTKTENSQLNDFLNSKGNGIIGGYL
ncbi:hypothetical protein ABEG63_12555 [Chryseobacterium sp. C39-AII1]